MRFEALHQRIKRYTKNTGFKNPGVTMVKKFQMRQALVFSGADGFETHPHLHPEMSLKLGKDSEVKEIICRGKVLRSGKR